jgi:hypothetical protein
LYSVYLLQNYGKNFNKPIVSFFREITFPEAFSLTAIKKGKLYVLSSFVKVLGTCFLLPDFNMLNGIGARNMQQVAPFGMMITPCIGR